MKTYLGDSVYAEWSGYDIVLTTENGYTDDPRNRIVMDPNVVLAFTDFLDKVAGDYKKSGLPQ